MNSEHQVRSNSLHIAVIGLGYVGLPLAIALAAKYRVIGFDINPDRVQSLRLGHDDSGEVSAAELSSVAIQFSTDSNDLKTAQVFVVAVPTPVDADNLPDLGPLLSATRLVGNSLKTGDIVIYESTVYPGATEEQCVPELERSSGLRFNIDFTVGYSPERINPGDRQRRLPDIVKVTSGSTPQCAEFVDGLYRQIIPAGTHLAPSIRVAEAAKAVENTQRDINIAFVNELAKIFDRMQIDTDAVLAAAATKWNFLPFKPGLVGGHCIGVDPYYLIHKAEEVGADPKLIRAARVINESMSDHVVDRLCSEMSRRRIPVNGARILVLGLTFKENCSDLRNTRVVEITAKLSSLGATVAIVDPWANPNLAASEYGIELTAEPIAAAYDAILVAVAHQQFRSMSAEQVQILRAPTSVMLDVKSILRHLPDVISL